MLVAAVVPGLRSAGDTAAIRPIARRFGIGSLVALAVLVVTGSAMASEDGLWDDGTLQLKLAVVTGIGVLTGVHLARPQNRAIPVAIFGASLVVVWLGLSLAH